MFLTSSLGCAEPPDAACEQKIGDELKIDRFVWGTMKKDGTDVVGEIHLWIRDKGGKSTTYRYPLSVVVPGDTVFVNLIGEKFEEVAGPPPPAKVTLKAEGLNGSVWVDGKEVGKLVGGTATVDVPPGSHGIKVVVDGYEDMSTTIEVKAAEQRSISLLPVKESDGPDVQKILGFTSLGLGVAALGGAAGTTYGVIKTRQNLTDWGKSQSTGGIFFRPDDDDVEYQICDPGTGNSYPNILPLDSPRPREVLDWCNDGKTFETANIILWSVGGALAGTGILMLATSDWSGDGNQEEAKLPFLLVPNFGPEGGDVTFSMRF